MKKVINLVAYKHLLENIEYYNSKMIEFINIYNESLIDTDYVEYEYYKNELLKLNKDLRDILS